MSNILIIHAQSTNELIQVGKMFDFRFFIRYANNVTNCSTRQSFGFGNLFNSLDQICYHLLVEFLRQYYRAWPMKATQENVRFIAIQI